LDYEVARGLLNLIILDFYKDGQPHKVSELLKLLPKKLDIEFSPGTVYTRLTDLQLHGLLKREGKTGEPQTYEITEKGKKTRANWMKSAQKIVALMEWLPEA